MVHLVDRPPLTIGQGPRATLWFAVVPPAEAACYVRSEGLGGRTAAARVSEVLAAYLVPEAEDRRRRAPRSAACRRRGRDRPRWTRCTARSWPSEPIEQWRLDTVRPVTRRS